MKAITVAAPAGLPRASREILSLAGTKKIFALYGKMGSGKTALIKAICQSLGVSHPTSSPTFALVNEYLSGNGQKIYHFDFYRIKDENEALDIGCEEYFASGNYCFIEWPEKVQKLLPPGMVKIYIEVKNKTREIRVEI